MTSFLVRVAVNTGGVLLAGALLGPELLLVGDVGAAILFALVLGLLNAFVRPVLALVTLPLTIVTFGLFALVLNALMFLVADLVVPTVRVGGFVGAFLAALIIAIVSAIASRLIK